MEKSTKTIICGLVAGIIGGALATYFLKKSKNKGKEE